MKKLFAFLFIIALVMGGFSFSNGAEGIFAVEGVQKVCFVSGEEFGDEFECVKCGEKVFNFCSYDEAKAKTNLAKKADAVQFYADEKELGAMLKQIKFQQLFTEKVEQIEIFYGFSPCFSSSIMLDGKKVNVQIAKKDGKVILGFPMIMTGF